MSDTKHTPGPWQACFTVKRIRAFGYDIYTGPHGTVVKREYLKPLPKTDSHRGEIMNNSGLVMKYFVLKPRGTDRYAAASRQAMRIYSAEIESVNPALADELARWANQEEDAAKEGGSCTTESLPRSPGPR